MKNPYIHIRSFRSILAVVLALAMSAGTIYAAPPPVIVPHADGYLFNVIGDSIYFMLDDSTLIISPAGIYWEPDTVLSRALVDSIVNGYGRFSGDEIWSQNGDTALLIDDDGDTIAIMYDNDGAPPNGLVTWKVGTEDQKLRLQVDSINLGEGPVGSIDGTRLSISAGVLNVDLSGALIDLTSEVTGVLPDGNVADDITIDEASDVDTAGTKISAALGTRMDNTGDTVTGTYNFSGGPLEFVRMIDFDDTITAPSHSEGRVFYHRIDNTLAYYNNEADVTMNIGQEGWVYVRNITGSTILDGKVVSITGAVSSRPTITLARADNVDSCKLLGVATHDIETASNGYVTIWGVVHGINLSDFSDGDEVFLSAAVAGTLTTVPPSAPNCVIEVGYVIDASANGDLFVLLGKNKSLNMLQDVLISGPATGNVLVYDGTAWADSESVPLADSATKALGDASGNTITTTYETISNVAKIGDDTANFKTAYGWGDHSAQNYLDNDDANVDTAAWNAASVGAWVASNDTMFLVDTDGDTLAAYWDDDAGNVMWQVATEDQTLRLLLDTIGIGGDVISEFARYGLVVTSNGLEVDTADAVADAETLPVTGNAVYDWVTAQNYLDNDDANVDTAAWNAGGAGFWDTTGDGDTVVLVGESDTLITLADTGTSTSIETENAAGFMFLDPVTIISGKIFTFDSAQTAGGSQGLYAQVVSANGLKTNSFISYTLNDTIDFQSPLKMDSSINMQGNKVTDLADAANDSDAVSKQYMEAQSYLTGNESITLSGDVSGSGATAITTTIEANAVESTMIGADQVNDLDINFGAGTDQVSSDDLPAHTGDVTGGTALTIAANAVESTMVGADQINDLDINFGAGTDQVNSDDLPAHTGDVTGGTALTIAANAVESTMIGADEVNDLDVNFGTGTDQVSATDLPDFGTMTATDDNILVADGTDFESVAMSGDATINNGAMTVVDDLHDHVYSNIDATTSANWAGLVSDETGTGVWVFGTNPTLTTGVKINLAADSNVTIDARTNPRTVTRGALRLNHTPAIPGTRAILLDVDANSEAGTQGLHVNFVATDLEAGEVGLGIDVECVTSTSTGGVIRALEVSRSGIGAATVHAVHASAGVNPIHQEAGSFKTPTQVWGRDTSLTAWANLTTPDAVGRSDYDSVLFAEVDDYLYVGNTATFNEIDFVFNTFAGGPGINPTFEFSITAPNWTTFTPIDNTDGFRADGGIEWEVADLTSWASVTINGVASYYVRILRNQGGGATDPIEDRIRTSATTEYKWDSSGVVTVKRVNADTIGIGGDVINDFTGPTLDDSSGNLIVKDAGVGESKLNITNTPATGQYLSSGGSNQFTWVDPQYSYGDFTVLGNVAELNKITNWHMLADQAVNVDTFLLLPTFAYIDEDGAGDSTLWEKDSSCALHPYEFYLSNADYQYNFEDANGVRQSRILVHSPIPTVDGDSVDNHEHPVVLMSADGIGYQSLAVNTDGTLDSVDNPVFTKFSFSSGGDSIAYLSDNVMNMGADGNFWLYGRLNYNVPGAYKERYYASFFDTVGGAQFKHLSGGGDTLWTGIEVTSVEANINYLSLAVVTDPADSAEKYVALAVKYLAPGDPSIMRWASPYPCSSFVKTDSFSLSLPSTLSNGASPVVVWHIGVTAIKPDLWVMSATLVDKDEISEFNTPGSAEGWLFKSTDRGKTWSDSLFVIARDTTTDKFDSRIIYKWHFLPVDYGTHWGGEVLFSCKDSSTGYWSTARTTIAFKITTLDSGNMAANALSLPSNIATFTKAELATQTSDVTEYAEADGEVWTGVNDFGGATSLEIPNGTAPAPTVAGQLFYDTDDDLLEGTDGTNDFVVGGKWHIFLFAIDNPDALVCDTIKIPIRGNFPGGIVIDSIGILTSTSTSYSCVFEEWTDIDHSSGSESEIATVATSTSFEAASGGIAHTVEYDNLIAVDLDADDIDQVTIWIRYYMLGND